MAEVVKLQVCDIYGAKIVENGIDKQVHTHTTTVLRPFVWD